MSLKSFMFILWFICLLDMYIDLANYYFKFFYRQPLWETMTVFGRIFKILLLLLSKLCCIDRNEKIYWFKFWPCHPGVVSSICALAHNQVEAMLIYVRICLHQKLKYILSFTLFWNILHFKLITRMCSHFEPINVPMLCL